LPLVVISGLTGLASSENPEIKACNRNQILDGNKELNQ